MEAIEKDELPVLLTDFKAGLNAYLATTPTAVKPRTMADVIVFNQQNAAKVMPHFTQDLMEQAQATAGLRDPAYRQALARAKRLAGKQGIDALLKRHQLDALIAPTTGPAWPIDYANGDVIEGSASTPAAVAGYPHLTVPMGLVRGLPVGLSFSPVRGQNTAYCNWARRLNAPDRRFRRPYCRKRKSQLSDRFSVSLPAFPRSSWSGHWCCHRSGSASPKHPQSASPGCRAP
jgi:amidase